MVYHHAGEYGISPLEHINVKLRCSRRPAELIILNPYMGLAEAVAVHPGVFFSQVAHWFRPFAEVAQPRQPNVWIRMTVLYCRHSPHRVGSTVVPIRRW